MQLSVLPGINLENFIRMLKGNQHSPVVSELYDSAMEVLQKKLVIQLDTKNERVTKFVFKILKIFLGVSH